MAENKTKATQASVAGYLATIADETRRKDCQILAKLMTKITKHKPKMWGTSIVGFGSYHYKYASGHEGDSCITGFASRKNEIVIYLTANVFQQTELLAKLGKHKLGKGCLYIRKLSEVNLDVLTQIIASTVATREQSSS